MGKILNCRYQSVDNRKPKLGTQKITSTRHRGRSDIHVVRISSKLYGVHEKWNGDYDTAIHHD